MKSSVIAILPLALGLTVAQNGAASASPSIDRAIDAPAAQPLTQTATAQPRIESLPERGSGIERIRATIAIDAPIDRVRTVMFDYARYPEFMPMYKKASVLSTTPAGERLVHMELGGVISLWMRVQISAPVIKNGVESYDGKLVQGNIKAFRPRWELESLSPDATRVTVESYLDPDLPLVPDGLVNSGARDGVRDSILALKARVEGKPAK